MGDLRSYQTSHGRKQHSGHVQLGALTPGMIAKLRGNNVGAESECRTSEPSDLRSCETSCDRAQHRDKVQLGALTPEMIAVLRGNTFANMTESECGTSESSDLRSCETSHDCAQRRDKMQLGALTLEMIALLRGSEVANNSAPLPSAEASAFSLSASAAPSDPAAVASEVLPKADLAAASPDVGFLQRLLRRPALLEESAVIDEQLEDSTAAAAAAAAAVALRTRRLKQHSRKSDLIALKKVLNTC